MSLNRTPFLLRLIFRRSIYFPWLRFDLSAFEPEIAQLVFFDLAVDRSPAFAKTLSGIHYIPTMLLQGRSNVGFFQSG